MDESKVIWSLGHAGRPDFGQAKQIIDLGVKLGIDGVEIEPDVERCLTYEKLPQLRKGVDRDAALSTRDEVKRIAAYAKEQGLRVSQWLHELSGPRPLLDLWPELRADDGFLDLDSPRIRELILAQLDEHFDAVPEIDDITLTLTETQVCVMHRPYSDMPLLDRVLIVLNAVIEGVGAHGKGLIVRPFSALAEDYEAVLAGLERVEYGALAVMEKTEPSDWNPFLPDSPYLRKVGDLEIRAEADANAEYYGQTMVPACYPTYLIGRLRAAYDRDVRTFVLRADRRNRIAPGTLNEINLVAGTAWAKNPELDMEALWRGWLTGRFGGAPDGMAELLEQTFEVIKLALYIDQQQMSHDRFPSFENAKHVQVFHLFERAGNLRHMRDHWSMIADRKTRPHDEIIQEKEDAVAMAESLLAWFDGLSGAVSDQARQEIRRMLNGLALLARGSLAVVRCIAAHLEDAWRQRKRAVGPFEEEAQALLDAADQVAAEEGEEFFAEMPARMRGFVEGLRREREIELPRRKQLAEEERLVDYVLCGLASEGHKLSKRLHTGSTGLEGRRHYRAAGFGERQPFSYEIRLPKHEECRLEVTLAGSDADAVAEAWLGPHKLQLKPEAPELGASELAWPIAAGSVGSPARIEIWSTGSAPCRVSEIRVYEL